MKRFISYLFAILYILSGCSRKVEQMPLSESSAVNSSGASLSPVDPPAEDETQAAEPHAGGQLGQSYIHNVVEESIARFMKPGMTEYEKTKAAFDYLIETTYFEKPVALDIWRIRGGGETPPYVENKSLSVLLFGLGECEDYAAALTMLLRGMGMEAGYVPGLTYSVEGALVDHAWTTAKVDGIWYHLDSQLQDNISKNRSINYRYFMKGDATMRSSHRWGQNLIDSDLLTQEQNSEIAEQFLYPPCPEDHPTPTPKEYTPTPLSDAAAILGAVREERLIYESLYGPLESLELNSTPPVFAWEGFGPPD